MDPKKQKEEFNYAYVCALAAHAGLNRGDFRVDDDSIDVTFQGKGFSGPGRMRSPLIQIQLKCTSQDLVVDGTIKFPLSRKKYDDLRGDDVVAPRYLAVLIVPEDLVEWVKHNENHVALYNTCYWLTAAMLGADAWIRAVAGSQKTRRVAPVRLKRALATPVIDSSHRAEFSSH